MSYPDLILRGISSADYVTKEGLVSAAAFEFYENNQRELGLLEASINWDDDDGAKTQILNQKKEKKGQLVNQFDYGYATMNRKQLDAIISWYEDIEIGYERYPLHDNKYHGNLLLQKNLSPQTKKLICGTIGSASKLIKRE